MDGDPRAVSDLVYSDISDNLVFMVRADAEEQAALMLAYAAAKTWGEFCDLAPPKLYAEVLELMEPEYPSIPSFLIPYRLAHPSASGPAAAAACRARAHTAPPGHTG